MTSVTNSTATFVGGRYYIINSDDIYPTWSFESFNVNASGQRSGKSNYPGKKFSWEEIVLPETYTEPRVVA